MEKEIILNQSLDASQIAKANILVLLTSKLKYYFFIIVLVCILNVTINIVNPFGILKHSQLDLKDFIPILVVLIVPYFILKAIKKSAQKVDAEKSRFFKNVNYVFNADTFKIEGENFKNTYNWNEIKKIKETKHWFFVYTNEYQAVALDKNQQEKIKIEEMKNFFNSLNIKKNLL